MNIDQFERLLMTALLAGDDPLLAALRQQYEFSVVRSREVSDAGLVTRFSVPADAPRIDRKALHLDDLQLELEGARTPAEASLLVRNGKIDTLACSVYEGELPAEPVVTGARYYGTETFAGITPEMMERRDLEELLEED